MCSEQMIVCRGAPELQPPPDGSDAEGDYWDICGWRTYRSVSVLGHTIVGSIVRILLAEHVGGGMARHQGRPGAGRRVAPPPLHGHDLAIDDLQHSALGLKRSDGARPRPLAAQVHRVPPRRPPYPLDDPAAFVRRRGRHASVVKATAGAWSEKHASLDHSWWHHINRRPAEHGARRIAAIQPERDGSRRGARRAGALVLGGRRLAYMATCRVGGRPAWRLRGTHTILQHR